MQFSKGGSGTITLDSGAGVNVLPKKMVDEGELLPKRAGLSMVAANGAEIENVGQAIVKFRGMEAPFNGEFKEVFSRQTCTA